MYAKGRKGRCRLASSDRETTAATLINDYAGR
jgi:hypothetical protein